MEPNTKESLIIAGNLIREGRNKSARAIILNVLREDKESAQAWFMLSYTIPDLEKQIYAIRQALLYRPESAKAQKRLEDLTGELSSRADESQEPQIEPPLEEEEIEYSDPVFPSVPPESEQEEEPDTPDDQQVEQIDPLEALRTSVGEYQHIRAEGQEPAFTPRVDEIRKEVSEKEQSTRIFGIRRTQFFLFAAVLLIIITIIAVVASNIRQELSQSRSTPLPQQPTAANTLVPTPEPAQADQPQEPANTPESKDLPAPTEQPASVDDTFSWNSLQPPTGITQENMDAVTEQLLALIGTDIVPAFQTYSVSDLELQGLVHAFHNLPEFEGQVENTSLFYQAIGLAAPEDNFSSLYANYWIDPNGTLSLPHDNTIAVYGYDFNDYQKYSYALGVTQIIRQTQLPDAPIFSVGFPCFLPAEKCDILNSVIKGEAAFSADQWAKENMESDAYQLLAETNTKYTFSPITPVPTSLMETLVKSPYQLGYQFAESVYQSQGWAGLENLYNNPPRSMEQILHPEKYLSGEEPKGIIAADLGEILGVEWTPLFKGPIGEWKTYLLLTHNPNPILRLDVETAERAADGWNGDQAQVFTTVDGKTVALFHWAWDSSGEQSQFEFVLREHAKRMINGLEAQFNDIACDVSSYQASCILASAEETIWLLTPDLDTAALILESYFLSAE